MSAQPPPTHRSPKGAFTLVEILIAMTILSLLLVMLMAMVDSSTKLWRSSETRVDSFREARAALNIIAADLRSAFPSRTEFFQLNVADPLPGTAVPPNEAGNLFFLTRMPADSQDPTAQSDLCSVGYFLAYDSVSLGSSRKTMNLYRVFESSNTAFERVEASTSLPGRTLSTGPSGEEVLARNIVDFKVDAFSYDANGALESFVQSAETPIPDVVEVELVAVNHESSERLQSESDWKDRSSPLFKETARVFKSRVGLTRPTGYPTPTPDPPSP